MQEEIYREMCMTGMFGLIRYEKENTFSAHSTRCCRIPKKKERKKNGDDDINESSKGSYLMGLR